MIDGSGYHHNRCLSHDHSFLGLFCVVAVGSSIFNSKKTEPKNLIGWICNKTI